MPGPAPRRRLLLLGNPNVGKSVLFHALTGRYVTVSNYPGTTVALSTGAARLAGETLDVVDSPGVRSLLPHSEDERVARALLLEPGDAVVLQVADARNLGRALALTLQLAEAGRPLLLALNLVDEARERGMEIDHEALGRALGVPVVPTVAVRREGVERLRRAVAQARPAGAAVDYGAAVEGAVRALLPLLPPAPMAPRGLALLLLAGDADLLAWVRERAAPAALAAIEAAAASLRAALVEPVAYVLQRRRLAAAEAIVARVLRRGAARGGAAREALGRWSMHPLLGLPVLVGVLALAYVLVGQVGAGTAVDLLEEGLFASHVNPAAIRLVDALARFPHEHLRDGAGHRTAAYALVSGAAGGGLARGAHDLVVGEYGVVTMALTYAVAIVLPVVGAFFLFFGLLEDTGYLPRLTVMADRLLRPLGLNGKAVLPLVLGLGCATMATLTTRVLETRKERVIATLLLALSVPCSAQLGVVLGMLAGVSAWGAVLWVAVLGGSLLVVGLLARALVPGESSEFVIELPPVRLPGIGNLLAKTLARVEWYLREAVPLFVLGTLLLFVLDRTGALALATAAARPVVTGLLGLPDEAARAFLAGFLRRDYGAAGLFAMQRAGALAPVQVVVSLCVITLFLPCVANLFMMWKERGARVAVAMAAFVVLFAVAAGAGVRLVVERLGVPL